MAALGVGTRSSVNPWLVQEWVQCSCMSCTSTHQSWSRVEAEEAEWRQKKQSGGGRRGWEEEEVEGRRKKWSGGRRSGVEAEEVEWRQKKQSGGGGGGVEVEAVGGG